MNIKSWNVLPLDKDKAADIAERYNLSHILAMFLQIRGADTDEKINALIGQDDAMESPFVLKDMDKAVARISKAVDNFEKIAIYGDYDADGITATAILYTYLESAGADVMYYIPKREGEGYGMNEEAIITLSESSVTLIITVDNGISSIAEVEKANELGIDIVITDHHRPRKILPQALAVIDPYRPDCMSKFKDFSGAGIALKLVMALEWEISAPDDILFSYSDLAALGTIGDVVPLIGENRIIVKRGIERLCESDREGIIALIDKASLTGVTATSVAFTLVPRINATGRMGSPDRAVDLLTTEFHDDAVILADDICKENELRKDVESRISSAAIQQIEDNEKLKFSRVIVVDGENWHGGVLGIVASRIVERYGKPTIVISSNGEEAKGSGRSIDGFSLFDAISYCDDILLRFGGHHMAVGVTISPNKIDDFRKKINTYALKNAYIMPAQKVNIDCKLLPSAFTPFIPQTLTPLEPFGNGNTSPIFGMYSMVLENITPVGGGNHLRLNLKRDNVSITCMKFRCKQEDFPYKIGTMLDLAVALDNKEYKGNISLTIMIRDMKPSAIDINACIETYRLYENFKRLESMTANELHEITPTREDLADIYRTIRAENGWKLSPLQLLAILPRQKIRLGKLLIAIEVLKERGLIIARGEDILNLKIIETSKKTDIFDSEVFKILRGLTKEG